MTAAVKNSFVIIDLWEIGYRKTLNISPPKYKFPVYKPIKIPTQNEKNMWRNVIFNKSTEFNAPPQVFLSFNEANGTEL